MQWRAEALPHEGRTSGPTDRARHTDLLWLGLGLLLLIASGFGLRDPWPADEPRFAAIARDMLATGEWLFPRVGGDLYPDKPPLSFWLLATAWSLTGSMRLAILLPSLAAACGTTFLVYDLARRLAGRTAGLYAAGLLLSTIQFVIVMRSAQIDGTLCLLTTASLYAFLRHLLLGPAWGWCFVGGVAAGLGVITKGVGFLPLLLFLPYAVLRRMRFTGLPEIQGGARWGLAGIGFLLGVGVWLVPMLFTVASSGDSALAGYRDAILFRQTIDRYAAAWHHLKPWYYFAAEVIPALWLPTSALLLWLIPYWRHALRARDGRVWLPLAWALLTILFFSLSSGKRGIYILPALPAVVIAAAPALPALLRRPPVQWLSVALAGALVLTAIVCAAAYALDWSPAADALDGAGLASNAPLLVFAVLGGALGLAAWHRSPLLAWPAVLAAFMVVFGYVVTPQITDERSGRAFMEGVSRVVPPDTELGLLDYKEQFLLYLDRPVVNFGHARYAEDGGHGPSMHDAARWLNGAPRRALLMNEASISPCFEHAPRSDVGETARDRWILVRAPADETCAHYGDPRRVIRYDIAAPVTERQAR